MNEEHVVEYLKMTFGPGLVFGGWYIARILWKLGEKLTPLILNAITEMKMLRLSIDDLKKLSPRVDKLEVDTNESFRRIRTLEGNDLKPNGG